MPPIRARNDTTSYCRAPILETERRRKREASSWAKFGQLYSSWVIAHAFTVSLCDVEQLLWADGRVECDYRGVWRFRQRAYKGDRGVELTASSFRDEFARENDLRDNRRCTSCVVQGFYLAVFGAPDEDSDVDGLGEKRTAQRNVDLRFAESDARVGRTASHSSLRQHLLFATRFAQRRGLICNARGKVKRNALQRR